MILIFLIAVELILLACLAGSIEQESDFLSILLTLFIAAIAFFIFSVPISLSAFIANIPSIIIGIGAWFAIGGVWSTAKWHFYSSSDVIQYNMRESYRLWKKSQPDENETFNDSIYSREFKVSNNKAKVTRWIIWWPASLLWTLTYRFIRKISKVVYEALKNIFDKITSAQLDRAVHDAEKVESALNKNKIV